MNAPTHTCSYFCDKPECIKAQRDELREKLAAIESQPVPVEPKPFGHLCEWDSLNQALYYGEPGSASVDDWNKFPNVHHNLPLYSKDAIDSLQSALQRVTEERDSIKSEYQQIVDYVLGYFPLGMCYVNPIQAINVVVDRMTKAESINRRMVELMKRMRLELWYCNDQLVNGHGAHEGHTVTAVLAESAELLKEISNG